MLKKIKDRLEKVILNLLKELDFEILTLELNLDHTHLFISSYPQPGCHKLVRAFKERNSRILRKEFSELLKLPSFWIHSYFVSTAGKVSSETIQRYIAVQSII